MHVNALPLCKMDTITCLQKNSLKNLRCNSGRGHQDRLPHSCCVTTATGVCRPAAADAKLHKFGCHTIITDTVEAHSLQIITVLLMTTFVHGAAVISAFCLSR